VELEGVGLNPRRTAFLDVMRRMGARVEAEAQDGAGGGEPMGRIRVEGAVLTGTEVSGSEVGNVIEELPLVAVLGALARGRTVIRDAAELRVKESDRIAAMAACLRAAGADVEERPDGMVVNGHGPGSIAGGTVVSSRGDHRIAMCMAVLGLCAREPVGIEGTACVATSYPSFWSHLEEVGGRAEHGHCD
jgi:3-phosphoshikimate 1-carboxyvinyltransferase